MFDTVDPIGMSADTPHKQPPNPLKYKKGSRSCRTS